MSDIAHIVLSDGTSYDIKDIVARGSGFHTVKGTQSSSTASWSGRLPVDSLSDGLTIAYYLPQTSASNVTLDLTLSSGTTGPINVYYQDSTRMGTQFPAGTTILLTYWSAGSILVNGYPSSDNRWVLANSASQIYTQAYCDTDGSLAAKLATCSGYSRQDNSSVMVVFTNSNTAESALTLDINGTGACAININGLVSSASNCTLPAGSYFVQYNAGTYYIRTDGALPVNISGTAGYTPLETGIAIAGTNTDSTVVSPKVLVDTIQVRSPSTTIQYSVDNTGLLTISDPYPPFKLVYFGYNYTRPNPDSGTTRYLAVAATGSSQITYTWYRNLPGTSTITVDSSNHDYVATFSVSGYTSSIPLTVYCVVEDPLQNRSATTTVLTMYP